MFCSKNNASLTVGFTVGMTAGCGAVTVTLAWATVFPPAPVALAWYVVEADGLTVRFPEDSTVPTPLSIVTFVALLEVHERVVDCPASIASGDTVRETVGAGATASGGAGVSVLVGAGGGGATFLWQPVSVMSSDSANSAITTSEYLVLLIGGFSFMCLVS